MVGQSVQNFILPDQNGNDFDLYKNLDKNILLVFYPKDNSPVCSRQLSDYYLNKKKFLDKNIKIVGINIGTKQQHQSFCASLKIDFPMLSDETMEISKNFNAINIFGMNKRKVVLIGIDKKILFEKSTLPIFYDNSEHLLEMISQVL